jgi:hypothetical protein
MNRIRTAVLCLGGFLMLGVAACGSGGSGSGASAPASAPAGAPAAQASSTKVAKAGRALTPPGTKLGFRQQATVGWVPPSTQALTAGHAAVPLQVVVEGIEKGTLADFKNVQLNSKERSATPYYVNVRVTKLGQGGGGTENPALAFRAIDDRGQAQSSVTFIGDFQRCDDALPPKPFSKGKTFETCLTYLLPGGGSISEVDWNDGPAAPHSVSDYFEKPVVWRAGS